MFIIWLLSAAQWFFFIHIKDPECQSILCQSRCHFILFAIKVFNLQDYLGHYKFWGLWRHCYQQHGYFEKSLFVYLNNLNDIRTTKKCLIIPHLIYTQTQTCQGCENAEIDWPKLTGETNYICTLQFYGEQ
jgi:hypothetical protein